MVTISLDLSSSAPGTQITCVIDGEIKWQGDPYDAGTIEIALNDADSDHVLEIVLSGKTPEHTKIDAAGSIIDDLTVNIANISIDSINVDQLWYDFSTYSHDFNGAGPAVNEKFYGTMGCNGTLTLKFTTPIYLWLLEHM